MKTNTRKWTFIVGFALSLSMIGEHGLNMAHAYGPAQRGGGGGHAGGGGGGGGHAGGGGGSKSGGSHAGSGPIRGAGGIHAPATNGSRRSGGGGPQNTGGGIRNIGGAAGGHVAQRPGNTRSPSLSHPNPGGFRPGVTHVPSHGNSGNVAGNLRTITGSRSAPKNIPGIGRNNTHVSTPRITSHNGVSGIGNRPYNGNSLSVNNRRIGIGNNLYKPSYYQHAGYHGYWNGNRSNGIGSSLAYGIGSSLGYSIGSNLGYGWGLGRGTRYSNNYGFGGRYGSYGYSPLGWGLGGWGLGSLNYSSGYLGYSNPYYVTGGWSGYNYAQPISVSYNTPVIVENDSVSSSDVVLNNAVEAFRQNDYNAALDITNKGITRFPDDAVLHEFRSLVLFAKQDYQQSAATIHSVLAVGPGWDWTTMSGMYANVELYTTQLRALEAFARSNLQDAASQFLLAYHYLSCGHTDAAGLQFEHVVNLMPDDNVAVEMLRMIKPPSPANATITPAVSQALNQLADTNVTPVDPKALVGAWSATREDGSQFKLDLTDDAKFTWTFTPSGQKSQSFGGTYSVDQNVLALERKDGGSLVAEVTSAEAGKFNFRLLGAAEDDKGLNFRR